MTVETLKYHPSFILENSLRALITVGVILYVVGQFELTLLAGILLIFLAAVIAYNFWQWKKTIIRFSEIDVVVERDTLFKLKKTLPYSKIASVNVNRGVVNRIFGTSKLIININSGHNALAPEASLTFKQEVADRLRTEISGRLYRTDVPSFEEVGEPLVSFTTVDVILHSLFSVPTPQAILGVVFLLNSIWETSQAVVTEIQFDLGGSLISLGLFFFFLVLPMAQNLFHYYGFKVRRQGDTVFLEHGLIRTYRTSFRISRINAVRVKNTLVSRLLRRSSIEAEVVGVGSTGNEGSSRPVICLLKDNATTQLMLRELVPEFIYERQPDKQPKGARKVLLLQSAIAGIVLAAIAVYPSLLWYDHFISQPGGGIIDAVVPYLPPLFITLAVVAFFYSSFLSLRIREFDAGEELFTFVNGILDRETVVMNYDKVQMVHVIRGPLARRFGVAEARVFMLSSIGTKIITSGMFSEERLSKIGDTVMERLVSGKYDPRANELR